MPPAPQASLKPAARLWLGWFWVLPGAVLVIVGIVVGLGLSRRGERIIVRFKQGHGLKAGDAVRYRGITVGEVRSVELSEKLEGVDVVIDLRPSARGVAVKGSRFWVVRPQAALTGVSGLDTVVGAKYVAVLPGPDGGAERDFVGLEEPPAVDLEEPGGLTIVLTASRLSGLRPGVPLTYHQQRIGSVLKTRLADDGVEIDVYVLPEYKELVRDNSEFWNVSGLKVSAGLSSGLTLSAESLETVVAGGVATATRGKPGPPAEAGRRFRLFDERPRDRGAEIVVHFKNGHGLKPGDPLRHRGIGLGEVRSVELSKDLEGVDVVIDLRPGVEGVAVEGSRFWVVRPQADLTGLSGLDTVVGGKYVAVLPGPGGAAARKEFDGEPAPVLERGPGGLEIVVQDRRTGGLRPGAPLTYRGVRVGSVISSGLASDAGGVDVRVYVSPAYVRLVRENSVFWNVSGFKLSGFKLSLEVESVEALLAGGLAMATPTQPGKEARDGRRFTLEDEPKKWEDCNPSIPLVDPNLPEGVKPPRLVRATLKYRLPGRVYGTRPEERRGLLLPVAGRSKAWLLGPENLLSVPAGADHRSAVELAFEGVAQAVPAGKETGPLRWVELGPAQQKELKDLPTKKDQLRPADQIEDCLLVADSFAAPLPVSANHLKQEANGAAWTIDAARAGGLTGEQWHGAAAVSVKDGKVIGLLQAPEKGPRRIILLTKDLLRPLDE
jgi:paraquat-inducible protein B